jgi:hypothetical protein
MGGARKRRNTVRRNVTSLTDAHEYKPAYRHDNKLPMPAETPLGSRAVLDLYRHSLRLHGAAAKGTEIAASSSEHTQRICIGFSQEAACGRRFDCDCRTSSTWRLAASLPS